MNLDSFPQETSWSSVNQNFLLRGPAFAISWTQLVSDQSHRTLDESLIGTLLYCFLLAKPTSFNKKTKKIEKKNALEIRPSRPN